MLDSVVEEPGKLERAAIWQRHLEKFVITDRHRGPLIPPTSRPRSGATEHIFKYSNLSEEVGKRRIRCTALVAGFDLGPNVPSR